MEKTVKRLSIALSHEDLRLLENLKSAYQESYAMVIRRGLIALNHQLEQKDVEHVSKPEPSRKQ